MKFRDLLSAIYSRIDDVTLLRLKEEEITRLNNTIGELLKNQSRYHEQHVENSGKSLGEREFQLRKEFEVILRSKNNEIAMMKNKHKSFWDMYEELSQQTSELQKLKVILSERIGMAYSFTEESIKAMNISVTAIENFVSSMKRLENKIEKKLPER